MDYDRSIYRINRIKLEQMSWRYIIAGCSASQSTVNDSFTVSEQIVLFYHYNISILSLNSKNKGS